MLPLVGFGLVAAACLIGSFWFIDGGLPLLLVKHGGYWLLLFAFLVFLFSVFQNRKIYLREPVVLWRSDKWAFAAAALVVGVYFLLQDTWFKITMDEVVLASTSMHMHLEKEVFTADRGYEVNGAFYILGGYLDKRPYFFAFVVSLVHDLFGYRSDNVFYVNAVVAFCLLMGTYFTGKQFGGKRWGWLAMLLLISIPLVGVNVTGGGFELFNLLMILITVYLGKCWLDVPSPATLVAFTYSGLLLAQCRYESILFVFPVGAMILWVWWREKKIMLPWPMFFAPLILVPYVLQNKVLNESKVLWQLEEHQSTPFGLQYLGLNLKSAADFFLQFGNDQANSLLIVGITLLAVGLWVIYKFHYSAYHPREATSWRLPAWAFGLTIVFNFGLLMFYYWGQINDPAATRLGLPLHLALIFFSVFVLSRNPWSSTVAPVGIVCSLVFIWFIAIPNVAQSHYMRLAYDARQINWVSARLSAHAGPVLLLFDHHMIGLVEGVSASPVGYTLSRKPELAFHFKNKTFSEILVVHRESEPGVSLSEGLNSIQRAELEEHFDLEPLYSHVLGPGDVAKISRVTAIHLSEEEQETYNQNLAAFAAAKSEPDEEPIAYFSKWLP